MTPVFKRAKTVLALDRAATVIGCSNLCLRIAEHIIRRILKSFNVTGFPLHISRYEHGSAEQAFL
jgi:hypothetical protein